MATLKRALDRYILTHDLEPETVAWYWRVASVFSTWHGRLHHRRQHRANRIPTRRPAKCDVPLRSFHGEAISRFLADKRAAGAKPYYVKSLRGGLVAVLRAVRGKRPIEPVRSVKCPPLEPEGWTAREVQRLLSPGCDHMPPASRWKWELCISLAHYLGLDRCDIERLEQRHFADNGALLLRRRKTGKAPSGGIPRELLALIRQRCPRKGPICKMHISPEWFRRTFAGIVARAGLFGTFKKLRKSSGSLVEAQTPGLGHKHLGNTRSIFEIHYEARRLTRGKPTMPQRIRLPRTPGRGPRPAA